MAVMFMRNAVNYGPDRKLAAVENGAKGQLLKKEQVWARTRRQEWLATGPIRNNRKSLEEKSA